MHKTVLLKEAIDGLKVREGDVVVDATLGVGGHTVELSKAVGPTGKVTAIDLDPKAIEEFQEKGSFQNVELVCGNFGQLEDLVEVKSLSGNSFSSRNCQIPSEKIEERGGCVRSTRRRAPKDLQPESGDCSRKESFRTGSKEVSAILTDLGWRREQIDDPSYGMSFQQDNRLDMRLNPEKQRLTAHEIVNQYPVEKLGDIFQRFGEERYARKIARQIVSQRKNSPIESTQELAELVKRIKPTRGRKKIHPATQVFQALRIEVNQELENLEKFLEQGLQLLKSGGRLAVISFHSLEDRLVKEFFRANARGCICPKEFPQCVCENKPKVKIITKKPIRPSATELENNPSARSAKMRILEKL